jgi:mono/diheme cytochrome c family protein
VTARHVFACTSLALSVACTPSDDRFTDFHPPPTPPALAEGAAFFSTHCSSCHGVNASGTARGPALLHGVYRSSHHGDASFELAVRNGVRAHHWRFGDMPPVPGLMVNEVRAITAYVRWLQQLAGTDND